MSESVRVADVHVEPRPSRLYLAMSIVVIAECLTLLSLAVASLTIVWDPCAIFGGLLIAPLPGFLGLCQYAAVFQRRLGAARKASVCAFILGGFAAFILVTSAAEMLANGILPQLDIVLALASFAIPNLWIGVLNRRWSRNLMAAVHSSSVDRFRLSIQGLLGFVAVIAAFLALTLHFARSHGPEVGVNVSASEAKLHLPENAERVSFCHGVRGTIAFEFNTDEPSFRAWVEDGIGSLESQQANIKLRPIRGDFTIARYYSLTSQIPGPPSATIHDGLYYEWSFEDRGVYAAFDRKTNRAYYYAHFH